MAKEFDPRLGLWEYPVVEEVVFETQSLSKLQKIALMERLWDELSADGSLEPPLWHREVIESRSEEWDERESLGQDWEAAKEELRRDLR